MSKITLGDVYRAALKLTPEERVELLRRLKADQRRRESTGSSQDTPALDVGPPSEDPSPRQEDMYGDDER